MLLISVKYIFPIASFVIFPGVNELGRFIFGKILLGYPSPRTVNTHSPVPAIEKFDPYAQARIQLLPVSVTKITGCTLLLDGVYKTIVISRGELNNASTLLTPRADLSATPEGPFTESVYVEDVV